MKGHTPGMAYRREDTIPYVEIWQQPFWRWLIAQAYHLWEKISWRGFRLIEKYHEDLFKKKDDDFFIPLTNRQDLKCEHLTHKKRDTLAVIYTTQEQYDLITGKVHKTGKPRHEIKEPITIEES